ncbi:hypothetical protein R75461_08258 [Paraburkholderia nemoris]|nr:hypothetical protein R75461_08258 [Paraburkholderia nemoris]
MAVCTEVRHELALIFVTGQTDAAEEVRKAFKAGVGFLRVVRRYWLEAFDEFAQHKEALRKRMHEPIPVQGHWLRQVVRGYVAYHAVPTNARALVAFRHHVTDLWRRTLRRRSQKDAMTWERMRRIVNAWLPPPRILHPWPDRRFAVKHPR